MKKNMAQALMYIDSWPGFVYYVPRKLPRFYHRDTRIYGSRALWRKIWHRRGCWRANSSEKAVARWSIGNIVIAVILEDLRIKPRDGSTSRSNSQFQDIQIWLEPMGPTCESISHPLRSDQHIRISGHDFVRVFKERRLKANCYFPPFANDVIIHMCVYARLK